jgi:CelD/BcsL family acetyltransferase involved in cellulose biosynthesis
MTFGPSVLPTLGEHAADWNRLAIERGSPFLTHEWLSCWLRAFGRGDPEWLVLTDTDGALRAGALFERTSSRTMVAAANVHSGDWDVLGSDPNALTAAWEAVAAMGAYRIAVRGLPQHGIPADTALAALTSAGYRTVTTLGPFSPALELPSNWDELFASVSSNLRKTVARRRRALEREGTLALRLNTGGPGLDADLDAFLKVEASGWKARAGTAIVSTEQTQRLYREFAHAAAEQGWLRLYLLELDGVPLAADYGCAIGGRGLLLKTGFDEAYGRFSPGVVLRADVLRASIEEGLRCYDMLGGPDRYKLSWTSTVNPRLNIWAYRGLSAAPAYAYRKRLRPVLKAVKTKLRKEDR